MAIPAPVQMAWHWMHMERTVQVHTNIWEFHDQHLAYMRNLVRCPIVTCHSFTHLSIHLMIV